jgi:hypothetical protein
MIASGIDGLSQGDKLEAIVMGMYMQTHEKKHKLE